MNLRGTLPTLILEALENQPDHGYSIAQRIKERSSGILDFKEGTLYPALHKLELEELLASYEEIEKGRTRRYYRITNKGRGALAKGRAEWQKLAGVVSLILKEAP
ncbi:MAG: helix-turn-helix transcriptional regulator [Acidobacteriota bacterium]